jgi:hypothetical protein
VIVAHQDFWVECPVAVVGSSTGVHGWFLANVWWGEQVWLFGGVWWGGI